MPRKRDVLEKRILLLERRLAALEDRELRPGNHFVQLVATVTGTSALWLVSVAAYRSVRQLAAGRKARRP